MSERPVILATNDDGASSAGLLALATTLTEWADVTVVAPLDQESRTSRGTPAGRSGRIFALQIPYMDDLVRVYGVDGTPAQAIQHGLLEILSTRPSLVVSGINYGENVGITSTVSGTIGAILESASWEIRSIAFSQEMPGDNTVDNPQHDFELAGALSSTFCRAILRASNLAANAYKVDYPANLSRSTEWKPAFVSRVRKYDVHPTPRAEMWERGPLTLNHEAWRAKRGEFEIGSDAYVLFVQRSVAVSPLTPDPTQHAGLEDTASLVASLALE